MSHSLDSGLPAVQEIFGAKTPQVLSEPAVA
jgi:hypothetical protein